MIWPSLQTAAQIAISHTLNSLPEGFLIAFFAWTMLRILPRQNSGTRFAVWMLALLAVAGLPAIGFALSGRIALGVFTGSHALPMLAGTRPLLTLSGPWALCLFLVWIVAASAAMLRLALGLWRLRELRGSCTAVDLADLAPGIRKALAEFSSSRSVTLAQSEKVSVPAAIGFFKPMIVLPAWVLKELPAEELNVILIHELAHLRRWDDWTNLLQKMMRAVFVFHPAVWWIESRLSLEREMACDDAVLAATANPRAYAKCLVAFMEKSFARRGWVMAQAVVNRAREAALRLAQILDAKRPDSKHVWKPALGLVGAFSAICLLAVPNAPEFVAFEQNTRAIQTTTALVQPDFSAAVIPASFHSTAPASHDSTPRPQVRKAASHKRIEHRAAEQLVSTRSVVAPAATAHLSPDTDPDRADIVNAAATETALADETLLVVRTTQRIGPNSWMWSVHVWRLTWIPPAQDQAAVPAAKKT